MKCIPQRHRWQSLICLAVFSILAIYSSGYYLTRIPRHGRDRTSTDHLSKTDLSNATETAAAFVPGVVEPGKHYTRTLVIASLQEEDTSWARELARDDRSLTAAVYIVDNPTAPLTVPRNKGHEVMVYLTHIIDRYDSLSDVSIFMHAHLVTWHNNDMLDSNSANMVKRLRSEKVIRDGYMSLRCHWEPGCPGNIHPTKGGDDLANFPEAAVMAKSWQQLFPESPIPEVLSQPCCGQFAVSADRIRRIPRETYIFYRDWLLNSPLHDRLSGRVWEYVWQYVFAGVEELCPEEHVCYCEGYGICFNGKHEYDYYYEMRSLGIDIQRQVDALKTNGTVHEGSELKVQALQTKISHLLGEMDKIKSRVLGH
ncbi:uncharacterized protein GIQ15_04529 [Arthroderma uncinatum]|uniref:uncharacterized protein n=1 Tax=Arthroderma uncinatum TaxID=74035 RepID=UPI00144AE78A|nr:uncharacterized protein GIQ15_04529 [Arthroderma uncinatum]KAF3481770.1 hypothetical protein GIQ15_04529 [Arthroderma uncinatum]